MNLSWSVLALALIGRTGPAAQSAQAPKPFIRGQDRLLRSRVDRERVVSQGVHGDRLPGLRRCEGGLSQARRSGEGGGLCAERLVTYLLDEAKDAACARIAEATGCDAKTPSGHPTRRQDRSAREDRSPRRWRCSSQSREATDDQRTGSPGILAMTLDAAIRIALDNNEVVARHRLRCSGHSHRRIRTDAPERPAIRETTDVEAPADRDRPAQRRCRRLAVQGRDHGGGSLGRATVLEPGPGHVQLWAADRAVSRPRRFSNASRRKSRSAAARSPMSPRPPSGSSSSTSTW